MAHSEPERDLIINKAGYIIQSKITDSLQGIYLLFTLTSEDYPQNQVT